MRIARIALLLSALVFTGCATPNSWARGAVFYEVFVRSFQDGNGDGKGDLPGLISRLDYLNDGDPRTTTDLGVDALWLMPVFASPSYHGYDTTDYETINPDYGSNEDFVRLCREAHRRGVRVIVDLVLNHSSSKHPWFVDAASSESAKHRDWYVWRKEDPGWPQPWNSSGRSWHASGDAFYYGLFWGGMPDLNFQSAEVRAEARRIAKLWLDRGVDGFRLDASRHLIETGPGDGQSDTEETHAYWREFSAYVREVAPGAILVGENWTDTPVIARYYGDTTKVPGGDELPMSFDFPLAQRIVAGARQKEASLVANKLAEIAKLYPPGATLVPFLANHDQIRLATNLRKDMGALRSAASVLLTLPGAPFLYYGEEVGMENGPGGEDEWKRTPMPWDATPNAGFSTARPWHALAPGQAEANVAAQTNDPTSLLSHYRRLIAARHASRALRTGRIEVLTPEGPLLAWTLTDGDERVLVVHNLDEERHDEALPGAVAGRPGPPLLLTGDGGALTPEGTTLRVQLPPRSTGIWPLR